MDFGPHVASKQLNNSSGPFLVYSVGSFCSSYKLLGVREGRGGTISFPRRSLTSEERYLLLGEVDKPSSDLHLDSSDRDSSVILYLILKVKDNVKRLCLQDHDPGIAHPWILVSDQQHISAPLYAVWREERSLKIRKKG